MRTRKCPGVVFACAVTLGLGPLVGGMPDVLGQTLDAIPGLAGGIIRTHFVSGDGSKVVFSSAGDPAGQNADGNIEIFVYDVATKQTFQLTQTASQPRFNDNDGALPNDDATRIVFRSRFNLGGGGGELAGRDLFLATVDYSTPAPGITFRRLTTTSESGPYALSGDGRYVALASSNDIAGRNPQRDIQIFRISLDPAPAIQQVTTEAGGIADSFVWFEVDIDYNGSYIVFNSARNLAGANPEGNQEIFSTTSSGFLQAVTATPAGANNTRPRFASATYVAFRSNGNLTGANADGNYEIFVGRVSGSPIHQITDTQGGDDNFGGANDQGEISSDGQTLVFVSNRDLVAGRNADGDRELFLATVRYSPFDVTFEQLTDTSNPNPGTRIENVYPRIDRDALHIAFNSDLAPGGIAGSLLYLISRPAPPPPTAAPRIDLFFPGRGGPGVPVNIYGSSFGAATDVAFAGRSASFQRLTNTWIMAIAPAGVTEGPITVTAPGGVGTSANPFRLAQLVIDGSEFSQGLPAYPAIAGKDALVRTFARVSAVFSAWAITDARLTVTAPSGSVTEIAPRMYSSLIDDTTSSHFETDNINFFVPGSALAEAGHHDLRVRAFTVGTQVVDQSLSVTTVPTRDVVLAMQSMMRNPDAAEIDHVFQELAQFSRLHPVRAGLGGIQTAGAPSPTAGLRVGFIVPPMFSDLEGDGAIPTCVALAIYNASCWDEILRRLNELRTAFNALGDFEPIEFVTALMPRDRVISPVGAVIGCDDRLADGYGESPGHATWIALCNITTTLAHEVGHNIGLVPQGAANNDGGSHSVNSLVSGRNAFNLTRWEHVPDIMSVMCSPACGPDSIVFFEDTHNGQPVDYPFLVEQRGVSGGGAMLRSIQYAAVHDRTVVSDATPAKPTKEERWRGRRLMVNARIDRTGDLTVDGISGLPPGRYLSRDARTGPAELVILDAKGKILVRELLEMSRGGPPPAARASDSNPDFWTISVVRPLPFGASTVEIRYRGKTAYRLQAGARAPNVRFRTAGLLKGGRGAPSKVILQWAANDADGDKLHYRVDFSRDGRRFQPFVLRTDRTQLVIPLDVLPGGPNVRWRVTASDGLQAASVVSRPLRIPEHTPVAGIVSLRDGERVLQHGGLELRGMSFDMEDGLLGELSAPRERFVWRMNGRKLLGFGARVFARGPFKPGTHTVTLEVSDSSGRKAVASRRIIVEADNSARGRAIRRE